MFLDANRRENNYTVVKITSLLGNAVVIILFATVLYISYMPVSIDPIGGMQERYLVLIIYRHYIHWVSVEQRTEYLTIPLCVFQY